MWSLIFNGDLGVRCGSLLLIGDPGVGPYEDRGWVPTWGPRCGSLLIGDPGVGYF